jgi:hypothetical protein
MGVRDTSYYGWRDLEKAATPNIGYTSSVVDTSGTIYVCGYEKALNGSPPATSNTIGWIVKKSIGEGKFITIDSVPGVDFSNPSIATRYSN